jgi:hypothetical protein
LLADLDVHEVLPSGFFVISQRQIRCPLSMQYCAERWCFIKRVTHRHFDVDVMLAHHPVCKRTKRTVRILMKRALTAAATALITVIFPAHATNIVDEWASTKAPPAPELKAVTVDPKTTALLMLDL